MTMFEGRIRRALDYADNPFELHLRGKAGEKKTTEKIYGLSVPLAFDVADDFQSFKKGKQVYLSCGDSSEVAESPMKMSGFFSSTQRKRAWKFTR